MSKPKACRMVITVAVPEGETPQDVHDYMAKVCCEYTQGVCEEGLVVAESYVEDIPESEMVGDTLQNVVKALKDREAYT